MAPFFQHCRGPLPPLTAYQCMQSSTGITNRTETYAAALTVTNQDRRDNHQDPIINCLFRPPAPPAAAALRTPPWCLWANLKHNSCRVLRHTTRNGYIGHVYLPLRVITVSRIILVSKKARQFTQYSITRKLISPNMAKRCSVCEQWIKTTGGTHDCPGSGKTVNEPSVILGDGVDQAPLLHSVTSA